MRIIRSLIRFVSPRWKLRYQTVVNGEVYSEHDTDESARIRAYMYAYSDKKAEVETVWRRVDQ